MKYSVRIMLPDNLNKKYKLLEAILKKKSVFLSRHYYIINIIPHDLYENINNISTYP